MNTVKASRKCAIKVVDTVLDSGDLSDNDIAMSYLSIHSAKDECIAIVTEIIFQHTKNELQKQKEAFHAALDEVVSFDDENQKSNFIIDILNKLK